MKPGVQARIVAAELVGRVDRHGAWSNVVSAQLDMGAEDAGLVRHLLYGTLRNRNRIDRAIDDLASRPIGSIHPEVLDILRIAFHEVLFGRAPAHAVADVAVEATRVGGHRSATGFVNAMVRNLQRGGEPTVPHGICETLGIPQWLVADMEAAWGQGPAREFFEKSHTDAKVGVRMRDPDAPLPPDLSETGVPGVYYLSDGHPPPGAIVQDPASAAVVVALDPGPGDRVLDIGAAPGGKTLAVWDRRPETLLAIDVHPRRVVAGRRRTEALGFGGSWIRADGRRLPFAPQQFDRVLLDAPCTGLGTLRRRPEILFKVSAGERDRLAALQRQMLAAAHEMVKPGGRLVYSVCTVTPAETVEVVAGLGGRPPEGLPGSPAGEGWLMAPHLTGTDAMFITVFDR